MTPPRRRTMVMVALAAAVVWVPKVTAAPIAVGIGSFAGSTLTTFSGLADGTEVNGLTVNGILFQYSLGGGGQVIIDGGPGITNDITPPNIVAVGNDSGILTLTLPSFVNTFGYGYAIQNTIPVTNATTISLFSGATPLGTLSYNGVPDPTFTGGFAGIQNTDPFNIVRLTFNSAAAPSFAIDNIRTLNATSAVPEPTSLVLLGTGLIGMIRARARHRVVERR